jgi:hypothetical protein
MQVMFDEDRNNYDLWSVRKKQYGPGRFQGKGLKSDPAGPSNPSFYTAAQYAGPINSQSQPIDDLTAQLSRTRIDPRASIEKYQPAIVTKTQRKDAIDQVISEVLTQDLKVARSEKLLPDHPCFDLAYQYAEKWHISNEAIKNHVELACGYLKFPVIMLLNPAPTHEYLPFNEMVHGCITLQWIKYVLYRIGLGLADVIILDICTLLGSNRIRQLGNEGRGKKEQALSEAYDVTQKMLEMIKPNIIVSCQCSTSFSDWTAGGHMIPRELCSSIERARAREVRKVNISSHAINVVQAYHPSGFLNRKGHHDPSGKLLEELFRRLYIPCANWRRQLAEVASANNVIYGPKNISTRRKKDTEGNWDRIAERLVPITMVV